MADNLALKLLVAGVIGAVLGVAATDRNRFPTGLVYGGFNNGPPPGGRPPIDPRIGDGSVYGPFDGPPPGGLLRRPWPDWSRDGGYGPPGGPPRYPPPGQYRGVMRAPDHMARCWMEAEDWDFAVTGRYVPCPPGGMRWPRNG